MVRGIKNICLFFLFDCKLFLKRGRHLETWAAHTQPKPTSVPSEHPHPGGISPWWHFTDRPQRKQCYFLRPMFSRRSRDETLIRKPESHRSASRKTLNATLVRQGRLIFYLFLQDIVCDYSQYGNVCSCTLTPI